MNGDAARREELIRSLSFRSERIERHEILAKFVHAMMSGIDSEHIAVEIEVDVVQARPSP
jgi:hypothetical protein